MSRHSYVQFCDDIRFELGGKTSLIGVYGGELLVKSFPTSLPKLCVAAFMATPVDEPLETLTMQIAINDKVYSEAQIPADQLAHNQQAMMSSDPGDFPRIREMCMGFHAVLSLVTLEKPALVSVTFIADGVQQLAGRLRIKLA